MLTIGLTSAWASEVGADWAPRGKAICVLSWDFSSRWLSSRNGVAKRKFNKFVGLDDKNYKVMCLQKKSFLRRVKCLTRKCYETYCPPLETETHKSVNWLPLSMFIIDERKNTVVVSPGILFPVCDASSSRVILAFHYWEPFIYPGGERGFPRSEHDNAHIDLPSNQTAKPLIFRS